MEALDLKQDEEKILGWEVFPSKEIRDIANKKVPLDLRMTELVVPLVNPYDLIFDARRMVYGSFNPLV